MGNYRLKCIKYYFLILHILHPEWHQSILYTCAFFSDLILKHIGEILRIRKNLECCILALEYNKVKVAQEKRILSKSLYLNSIQIKSHLLKKEVFKLCHWALSILHSEQHSKFRGKIIRRQHLYYNWDVP